MQYLVQVWQLFSCCKLEVNWTEQRRSIRLATFLHSHFQALQLNTLEHTCLKAVCWPCNATTVDYYNRRAACTSYCVVCFGVSCFELLKWYLLLCCYWCPTSSWAENSAKHISTLFVKSLLSFKAVSLTSCRFHFQFTIAFSLSAACVAPTFPPATWVTLRFVSVEYTSKLPLVLYICEHSCWSCHSEMQAHLGHYVMVIKVQQFLLQPLPLSCVFVWGSKW